MSAEGRAAWRAERADARRIRAEKDTPPEELELAAARASAQRGLVSDLLLIAGTGAAGYGLGIAFGLWASCVFGGIVAMAYGWALGRVG